MVQQSQAPTVNAARVEEFNGGARQTSCTGRGLGVPSVFRIQRRGMNRRPLWQDEGRRTCPLTVKLMCSPLVSSFVLPASGAPTCAGHRMRQRIPAQCARGAPTSAAVGYCSVLCGNGTAALADSELATPLGCWMARMQAREPRAMHRAACGTHVQPAMRSKPCADDAPDGTEGYSGGTQGVLRGTQGYSDPG